MALVFKTPKTAINTTTRDMQNLSADCPPCPEVKLTTADVEYTENGSFTVTPESGFDGLSQVDITVNIPSDVKNQDKFVTPTTSSQTITADSGYSGLGTVSVSAVTSTIDHNITASNIKSGVTILGVTGTVTEGITPTGNINITNTNSTDVTNYATAQVVDANLTAGNIKSGTTILGVQGSYDPQPDLETKSVTYTANDTYTITPTAGKDGMSSVEVTVNVAGGGGTQCPDWSTIGWDCNDVTASGIEADLAYTAQKKAEYEAGTINNFSSDSKLIFAPNVNYPDNSRSFYAYDHKLTFVPPIEHTGKFKFDVQSMFNYCEDLKYVDITLDRTESIDDLFSDCSTLKTATLRNTSTVTSAKQAFRNCIYLEEAPLFDTSNVTNMSGMFLGCNQMLTTIPQYNTASVTDMSNCFSGCGKLVNVSLLDTSNVTNFSQGFRTCASMTSIPQFNTSNVENVQYMFERCLSLTTVPQLNFAKAQQISNIFGKCSNLTTLGGFINLGKGFISTDAAAYHTLDLSDSRVLTKESIMNVINNLAAPDNTAVTGTTLKLSATSYALLTAEDIAIATAKNWTVTSA